MKPTALATQHTEPLLHGVWSLLPWIMLVGGAVLVLIVCLELRAIRLRNRGRGRRKRLVLY